MGKNGTFDGELTDEGGSETDRIRGGGTEEDRVGGGERKGERVPLENWGDEGKRKGATEV